MKTRILKIIEDNKLNQAEFAEKIGVSKATVTNFIKNKRSPNMEVTQEILRQFPKISTDWFVLGKGDMYKKNNKIESKQTNKTPKVKEQSLSFSENSNNNNNNSLSDDNQIKTNNNNNNLKKPSPLAKIDKAEIFSEKEIKQIIICYTDFSFETYQNK